jgi:hypothetical protein
MLFCTGVAVSNTTSAPAHSDRADAYRLVVVVRK